VNFFYNHIVQYFKI